MSTSNTLKNFLTVCTAVIILTLIITPFRIHSSAAEGNLVIMLDPGHGGIDGGAENTVGGVYYNENKLMLKIANYAKSELSQYPGVTVLLTRENNDTYLTLAERVSKATANGAHAIISIHANSFSDNSTKGAEALVACGNYKADVANETKSIGNKILSQLEILGVKNRGIKTRLDNQDEIIEYYPDGSVQDYYGIVQRALRAGIPGVIVETAFISNESDVRNFFSSDSKLQSMGKAIATGIAKHYGLSKSTTASAVQKPHIDARELTFNGNPDTSLLYPLKGTKIAQSDGYATLSKGSDGIKVYIDYRGMAFSAETYKYAVIRLRSSSAEANVTINTGAYKVTYDKPEFTYKSTLTTEYKNILLDMSGSDEWEMAVNFIKIQISGTDSADIESIKFYESKNGIENGSAAIKPTIAPTKAPAIKPNSTAPSKTSSPPTTPATQNNSTTTIPTTALPVHTDLIENSIKPSDQIKSTQKATSSANPAQNNSAAEQQSDDNNYIVLIIALILFIMALTALFIIQLLKNHTKNNDIENNKFDNI